MSLLEIRNLEVSYTGHAGTKVRAVAGADLDVEAGQIVALVGESGCGKSSLGKAAVGLISPSAGTIHFDGEPLTALRRGARPKAQRKLQMVFQDPFSSLNPRRRIGDLIAEGGLVASEAGEVPMSVGECLERVGCHRPSPIVSAPVFGRTAPAHRHRPGPGGAAEMHRRR